MVHSDAERASEHPPPTFFRFRERMGGIGGRTARRSLAGGRRASASPTQAQETCNAASRGRRRQRRRTDGTSSPLTGQTEGRTPRKDVSACVRRTADGLTETALCRAKVRRCIRRGGGGDDVRVVVTTHERRRPRRRKGEGETHALLPAP